MSRRKHEVQGLSIVKAVIEMLSYHRARYRSRSAQGSRKSAHFQMRPMPIWSMKQYFSKKPPVASSASAHRQRMRANLNQQI
jgi:hypothetical protein